MNNDSNWGMSVADCLDNYPEVPWQVGCADPGWEDIICDALRCFRSVEAVTPAVITIQQIKEKFGGLRLYYHLDTSLCTEEEADAARLLSQTAVTLAEMGCWATCGACGTSEKEDAVDTRGPGWWKTRCLACHEDEGTRRGED